MENKQYQKYITKTVTKKMKKIYSELIININKTSVLYLKNYFHKNK